MTSAAGPSRLHDVDWPTARERARGLGADEIPHRSRVSALTEGLDLVVTEAVPALTDLPAFDTAAMDGWAVSGAGPWRLVGEVRAGHVPAPLAAGEAVRISTGAVAPPGAAVLRSERGEERGGLVTSLVPISAGTDIRPRGEEVAEGAVILPAGAVLTPPALGLLAAAGHDRVQVLPRPTVTALVLGDELVDRGVPGAGQVRDALSPQLPGWLETMGGSLDAVLRVDDTLDGTVGALSASRSDVIVTTGGTARGPADHVRAAVAALGGRWVVDEVRVRPGHPMKLALLPGGQPLVALPGNPLAAVSGLVTLAWPLLQALAGRPATPLVRRRLAAPLESSPGAHRLVPARVSEGSVVPALRRGPAMLSGLAEADVLLVLDPASTPTEAGAPVSVVPLPWGSGLLV